MITFSIILMSRSRPEMFNNLYQSIKDTTLLENEIIIGLDDDDEYLTDYKNIIQNTNNCILNIDKRNSNLHIRMNKMLDMVNGKYIFVLNDDCILTTMYWDKISHDILKNYGDIIYGRTVDNSIDRVDTTYAAFPIMSTVACKKLGMIMDDTFGNHGADVVTYRIYHKANKIVNLDCVTIDHVLHNSIQALHNRQNDRTAVDMINRTFSQPFDINQLFTLDISYKASLIQ